MITLDDLRPTWVEIDHGAFLRNVDAVLALLPRDAKLMAIMKADAYGHGAVELARRCDPGKVAMIGVALLEEAMELRRAGVGLPILVLGPLSLGQIAVAAANRITIGVPGPEEMELVAAVAREKEVTVHLKIDSGMGRMGTLETELPRLVELIRSAPRLRVEAIYSHLANAGDVGDPFTAVQLARFRSLVATLKEAGLGAPLLHIANSPAVMQGLVQPGELVRVGLALMGGATLTGDSRRFEPVMRWRTEIARLKEVPAGHAVGYGTTFHTTRPSRIATLPAGYADGYGRLLSNRGEVLVRGQRAPVVGRVSMDLITVDVTGVAEAAPGDEVILLGRQQSEEVTVEELASKLGTISHEVFCAVSARVPRIHVQNGASRIVTRFDS